MPSTGKSNGTVFLIFLNGTAVAHCTSSSMNLTAATRDVTTKTSGGWEEVEYALRSGEFSGDFYFAEDANIGFEDIYDSIANRTKWPFLYAPVAANGTEISGDVKYYGTVLVTNVTKDDPKEDTSTFSLSLKLTGALSKATIT